MRGAGLEEHGYLLAATTEAKFVTPASDPYLIPRFHVGDNFWFPEAICNMVGVWRPVMDPLTGILRSSKAMLHRLRHGAIAPARALSR